MEWRTFEEETPLILAARGGHFECLRTLLDCDADPNAETKENYSPLWEGRNYIICVTYDQYVVCISNWGRGSGC